MGTNYYFMLDKRNEIIEAVKNNDFYTAKELMDASEIHICKCSMGWLPLFQAHKGKFNSIVEMKKFYDANTPIIKNEYGEEFTWEQFSDKVICHNGGYKGAIKPKKIKRDKTLPFYDSNMPDHIPVSHFEYANGAYSSRYFKDPQGYEFTYEEFS